MNKVLVGLLVIGGISVVAGGVITGVGLLNKKADPLVTNEHELTENFTDIDIDIETAEIEIKKSENGTNKVVCHEHSKSVHNVYVQEGILFVKYQNDLPWYKKMFNFTFEKTTVTIYLTENSYSKAMIKTNTGDIKINSGFTFNAMNIESDTGDIENESNSLEYMNLETDTGTIKLNNISSESLDIDTDTGNVAITNSTITKKIEADCDTSNVTFTNVKCENMEIKNSTGDVELKNTIVENKINIETSTGDILFDKSDAETLNLKTSTGSITGTLLTSKIFQCTSSTGKITVPLSAEGGLCVASTSTGKINLSIA